MRLLKNIFFASVLLIPQYCLANICVNTSANHDMFATAIGADALVRGYDMAFRDSSFSDYQLFSADTSAELATQIQKMVSGRCSIVLGLFTSRECLIAGPILKKNKTIGISPICGHDDVGKFYPYLYTGTHPISRAAVTTMNYLNKMEISGKVFAIFQPTNVYSEAEFSEFKQRFTKPITEISVGLDGQFDINQFSYKKGESVTLVFFTYPLSSVNILVELSNHQMINKDVTIIGASSWNDDASLLKPIKSILEKAKAVVAADIVDWVKIKNSSFTKQFIKMFNREPLNVEVLNYDITRLAVQCYKKSLVNKKYDFNKFQYCITHTKYAGVSGTFSFGNQSSFADRPQYLTNVLDRM